LRRHQLLGRVSPGAGLALIGLALVGAGLVGTTAIAGQWVPIRGLLAARSPALAVPLVLLGVGVVAFLVGLVIYVFGPTRTREDAAATYARLPMVLATLAVASIPASAITLAYLYASGQAGATGPATPAVLLASIVPLEACLLLVLYLRLVRPGVLSWEDIGLSTRRLWSRLAVGAGSYLLVLVAVGAINYLLQSLGVQQTQTQTYQGVRAASGSDLAAIIVAGGVLAPIAEESFFRGYVFTAYRRTRGRVFAYLLSAGLFAIVHFNLPALPAVFAVGLVLAVLYDLTKSLIPGIVAHGLNNSFAFVILYFASGLVQSR
jgi:hypothetical protein